jgi:hypothetical protein
MCTVTKSIGNLSLKVVAGFHLEQENDCGFVFPCSTVSCWIFLLEGIVSCDFDGVFMILSYSLDVRHVPLHILFYFIVCFHSKI